MMTNKSNEELQDAYNKLDAAEMQISRMKKEQSRQHKIQQIKSDVDKIITDIKGCLLCAAIADPVEVIENTLSIINEFQKSNLTSSSTNKALSERVRILEEKLKFLVDNDSINDSSIDEEIRKLIDT